MFGHDDPKQLCHYENAARYTAFWFINNQCKPDKPWGDVFSSADTGRYIYEYYPVSGFARGMGVWGQTVGMEAALACVEAVSGLVVEAKNIRRHCYESAVRAARYMMTLQILDRRNERYFGAFREGTPQTLFSYPRDAATGGFGLLAMYRLTGVQEYLDRAVMFGDWYRRYGSDDSGWPHVTVRFDTGEVRDAHEKGVWQAGGGLVYHYLYEMTGDRVWLEEGLKPIADQVVPMFASAEAEGVGNLAGLHGMGGNDDFASLTVLAAWMHFKDRKYLERFAANMNGLMANQHPDGSFRNYAGTFMAGIEMLDAWQIRDQLDGLVDVDRLRQAIIKAADIGLTCQEIDDKRVRSFGGMYGQSFYGTGRDRIHQRSTGYASALYSRLVCPHPLPYWSAQNWQMAEQKLDLAPYLGPDAESSY